MNPDLKHAVDFDLKFDLKGDVISSTRRLKIRPLKLLERDN